jgi:hypothetical protein
MNPLFGRVSVNWNRPRLEQTPLEQKSDKADDDDGDDQRWNVAKTVAHQNPDTDCAQHQELAVRKIDDPCQSEDQRDANPHQDDHARDGEAVHELLDKGHHDTSLLGQRGGSR